MKILYYYKQRKLRKEAQQVLDSSQKIFGATLDDTYYCACGHNCTVYDLYDPETKLFHAICLTERRFLQQQLREDIEQDKKDYLKGD